MKTRIHSVMAVAIVIAMSLPLAAQQPTAQQEGSERFNRAPISKEILRVKLPKPVEATLPNGLTVLVLEDHRFPLVSVQLNISGAGALYEPAGLPGVANMTASMLREGSKTRSSRQISEEVDNLGASLSAATGWGSAATVLNASGLSDNFDSWFALTADVLINPTFPAEELSRLKLQAKAGLRNQRANPGFLANERFSKAVYGAHPASVRSATNESVDAMTPEILAKWHAEHYLPQNSVLAIAGDVNAQQTIAKLKTWLEGWKKTDAKETVPPNPAPAASKAVYVVDRPGSAQTDLTLGNIAISRTDADYIPLVVMDQIVGAGSASRLFANLRERKGYTYGAYSNFTALKYAGPWLANSQVRGEVTDGAMTEFFNEIKRIREETVDAKELEEQKRLIVARFALSLEQPATVLSFAVIRKIYGFADNYWDVYPEKIMAVTAADVQRVAKKYLNPEALQIVAVGDASKIKSVMEKYGPVQIFNAEGKPVAPEGSAK